MRTFYVSPSGTGTGSQINEPALYTSSDFWEVVQAALSTEPVIVRFLDGTYDAPVDLPSGLGHETHWLFLAGNSPDGTVLRVPPDPPFEEARLQLADCQNIVLQHLHFTGGGRLRYVTRISGTSHDIIFDSCTFINLPGVANGATGVLGEDVHHVTYQQCRFETIGSDSGAHMMYHANNSRYINVVNCTFKDCSGEYVRFRNNVDFCHVTGCSFICTGLYPEEGAESRPFISMPVLNDCEPGSERCPDPENHSQYEYFGTHYVIARNHFVYQTPSNPGERNAVHFKHQGFDPPKRNHLMTKPEGEILQQGDMTERKHLLKSHCNIDMENVRAYDNRHENVARTVAFGSFATYGAESKGWEGYVDIDDLVIADPVIQAPQLETVLSFVLQ